MGARFIRAVCAIAAFVVVAAAAGGVLAASENTAVPTDVGAAVQQEVFMGAQPMLESMGGSMFGEDESLWGALPLGSEASLRDESRLDEKEVDMRSQLPPGFEAEVMSLDKADEVRVSGSVIGFAQEGSAEAAFASISQTVVACGWVQAESGQATMGSFVKAGGTYRWLLVSCFDIAGSTSVVLQLQ